MFAGNPSTKCAENALFTIKKQILTKPLADPNRPLMIPACVRSSARGPLLIKPLKNAVNNSPNSNTQSHSATANGQTRDRKSTRLNSSHVATSYAVSSSKQKTTFV